MAIAQPARMPAASSPAWLRSASPRIESRARADMTEPAEAMEATERAEPSEPIDPIDAMDPTEPIERAELFEAMERNESSDQSDSELSPAMFLTARERRRPSGRRARVSQPPTHPPAH